jgi:transposase
MTRTATGPDGQSFARLQSVPGPGQMLAWVLLYEIQDLPRFPRVQAFGSSCRLGKCAKETNGKRVGTSGKKIGTGPWRWALAEAAVLFCRQHHPGKEDFARVAPKPGKATALVATAHKLARLVYRLLTHEEEYVAQGMAEYEQAYRERTAQNLVRKAKALGYKLLPAIDPGAHEVPE